MSSKHINSLNIRPLPDFPSLSLGYHISVVCDRKLYVIGGVNAVYDDSDDTNSRINQQIPYSGSDSNTWRVRHQKAFPEHKMYNLLRHIYIYDCQHCSWSVNEISGHTNCFVKGIENSATLVHNQKLYVFGGWTGRTHSNRMLSLDLLTYDISEIAFKENSLIPTPRAGHTMNSINRHEFLVFGGQGDGVNKASEFPLKIAVESEKYEHDVYNAQLLLFDCDTLEWTLLQEFERERCISPSARAYHSCTRVKEKLFMFGGRNRESGNFFLI